MASSLSPTSPTAHYYRRPLPLTCISFSSSEGKLLFREALLAGHMETYFALASQFRTQEEPAFCGLSTLVMVLNALEIDPKKVWKGPWRFYHENMLDCCVPMEVIEKQGITFDQFICLAVCNTLEVEHIRADSSTTIDEFRKTIIEKTRCANDVIVVSYSRQTLKQSGEGHFSPIGGYHPDRDLVLIMDVARFKYPPHWVSVSLLFEAMKQIDSETGLPRGYLLLTKSDSLGTMLFRFSAQVSVTRYAQRSIASKTADIIVCIESVRRSLAELCDETLTEEELIRQTTCHFFNHLNTYGYDMILLTSQIESTGDLSDNHLQVATSILQALESLSLYNVVCQVLKSLAGSDSESQTDIISFFGQNFGNIQGLSRVHCFAMLLLLWPYSYDSEGTLGGQMNKLVSALLESFTTEGQRLLRIEVAQLRRQLESVLGFVRTCCGCKCQRQIVSF